MVTVWNQVKLKAPSRSTCLYLRSELGFDEWQKFVNQLEATLKYLHNQGNLFSEVCLLQKIVVKMKHQFRHERFLQAMQKVYKCFQRLQEVNVQSVLEEFTKLFPDELKYPNMIDSIYLPSKQTLEFVLVRLMGLAQLVEKIIIYCKEVFHFSMQKIAIGVFIVTHLMILSVISRIWVLSKTFLSYLIEWYNIFRPWREKMKGTKIIWISDELPMDLATFLIKDNISKVNFDSFADDLASPELSFVHQISTMANSFSFQEAADMIPSVLNTVDLGEIINRDSIAELFKASQQEIEKKVRPKQRKISGKNKSIQYSQIKRNRNVILSSINGTNYREPTNKKENYRMLSSVRPAIDESWEIEDSEQELITDEDSHILKIAKTKRKTRSERSQNKKVTANKKQKCEVKTAVHIQDDIIKVKKASKSADERTKDKEVIEKCAYQDFKSKKKKKLISVRQKKPVNLAIKKFVNLQNEVNKLKLIKKKDEKIRIISTSDAQLTILDEKKGIKLPQKYQDSKLSFSYTYKTESSKKKSNQSISKKDVVTAVNNLKKISEIKNFYRNVKNQQPFIHGDSITKKFEKKSLKPLCQNLKRMLQRLKLTKEENKSSLSKVIIQEKRKLVQCMYEVLKLN